MNLTAYLNKFSIHHRLVDVQQPPDKTDYIYRIIQLQDSKLIFEYGDTFYSVKYK